MAPSHVRDTPFHDCPPYARPPRARPQWRCPTELHAIGRYAADAYLIFCRGTWRDVQVGQGSWPRWVRRYTSSKARLQNEFRGVENTAPCCALYSKCGQTPQVFTQGAPVVIRRNRSWVWGAAHSPPCRTSAIACRWCTARPTAWPNALPARSLMTRTSGCTAIGSKQRVGTGTLAPILLGPCDKYR